VRLTQSNGSTSSDGRRGEGCHEVCNGLPSSDAELAVATATLERITCGRCPMVGLGILPPSLEPSPASSSAVCTSDGPDGTVVASDVMPAWTVAVCVGCILLGTAHMVGHRR
jgi:hypothetical protein